MAATVSVAAILNLSIALSEVLRRFSESHRGPLGNWFMSLVEFNIERENLWKKTLMY